MRDRRVSKCVRLLNRVAEAASDAARAAPRPDSVMEVERRQDVDIGDHDLPYPYDFAHTLQRMLLYAAAERLMTLAWCVEAAPFPHHMSAAELARAAAEAATTAAWLGDIEADGRRRLSRMLDLLERSDRYETNVTTALGLPARQGGTQHALAWGKAAALTAESRGNFTDLFRRFNPQAGEADYRLLSGLAHSSPYALIDAWQQLVTAQEDDDHGPIGAHVVASSVRGAHYVLVGMRATVRLAGGSPHEANQLDRRLGRLEGALGD